MSSSYMMGFLSSERSAVIDRRYSETDRHNNIYICEYVAVQRVKRLVRPVIRLAVQHRALTDRRRFLDPAVWINYRADACICVTHLIAAVFHCPHDSHSEMLERRRGLAKPAVIRDHDNQLRTAFDKLPDKVRKNTLVTDGRGKPMLIDGADGKLRAEFKVD